MVDIMDMEDIFYEIIQKGIVNHESIHITTIKLIEEVADFVEGQLTIECNNCKGKKFKIVKEPWQAM